MATARCCAGSHRLGMLINNISNHFSLLFPMRNKEMRLPDFPATTHQLHIVPEFRQHYADLSNLMPEPILGEIRLAGTRRKYEVLIGIYALPPHAVGLDIWAPTDEARLRIGRHRDMWAELTSLLGPCSSTLPWGLLWKGRLRKSTCQFLSPL